MATDAQTLLSQVSCYQCNSPNGYSAQLIALGLLRQLVLALDPMADTSPQTLLAQASCYQCFSANPFMLKLIELGLLKGILEAVGSGFSGITGVYSGVGPPGGLIPGGTAAVYIDESNGDLYEFYSGSWH